jgi:hypothetical protein
MQISNFYKAFILVYNPLQQGIGKQLENMERTRSRDTKKHKLCLRRTLPAVALHNSKRTIATQPQRAILLEQEFRSKEIILLSTVSWYWGVLTPAQACYLMHQSPDGSFLATGFRETRGDHSNPNYSLAVKLQREVYIFKVRHQNGQLSLDFSNPLQPKALTLHGLVSKIVQASKTHGSVGKITSDRGTILASFKHPVSRISSLKAHCRRVVRLKFNRTSIKDLPLPEQLKTYLNTI